MGVQYKYKISEIDLKGGAPSPLFLQKLGLSPLNICRDRMSTVCGYPVGTAFLLISVGGLPILKIPGFVYDYEVVYISTGKEGLNSVPIMSTLLRSNKMDYFSN